ncbi:unnamed protein product, partial [Anisakis simplex]|uniref:SERPIN domain-containing protein n=1 Tax=Anisakis simplex TaxID=6269 RepID=A0A0M3J9A7_ANISI
MDFFVLFCMRTLQKKKEFYASPKFYANDTEFASSLPSLLTERGVGGTDGDTSGRVRHFVVRHWKPNALRAALRNDGCTALDADASTELGLCPGGATFTVWNCVQLI